MNIEETEIGKKVIHQREPAVITKIERRQERVWIAPSLPLKEHQKEVPLHELSPAP